jgi:hypothetical protein
MKIAERFSSPGSILVKKKPARQFTRRAVINNNLLNRDGQLELPVPQTFQNYEKNYSISFYGYGIHAFFCLPER